MGTIFFVVLAFWLWDTFVRKAPWWRQCLEWCVVIAVFCALWGVVAAVKWAWVHS